MKALKYEDYNKVIIDKSVQLYTKYWEKRNYILQNKEKQKERILRIYNSYKEESNNSRLPFIRNYFNQFTINVWLTSTERIS